MKNAFLIGSVIYLRKPDIENDVLNGNWNQWFNDQEITQYTTHGVWPIDVNDQKKVIESEMNNSKTMLFVIVGKSDEQLIGVVGLKNINLLNRNAEISIVMGKNIPGAAIEAMALLTQHAFDRLNLVKVYAGQHEDLWKWVNVLGTIGYKIEGVRSKMGIRNGKHYSVVLTGIDDTTYYKLKDERNGSILLKINELNRIKERRNIVEKLKSDLKEL